MCLRLIEAGAPCELHIFDGAPHAFDALPAYGRQCVELAALCLGRHVEVSAAPERKTLTDG